VKHLTLHAGTIGMTFILVLWAWVQIHTAAQADALFLLHAAGQILSGERMTESYFDSNPPMSFITYIPAALLRQFGFSPWNALYIYGFALTAISIFLCRAILNPMTDISKNTRDIVFWAIVLSVTSANVSGFAQKEHLIVLGLFPFLLTQWRINQTASKITKIQWAALILGTPFILMKPHFGLLPTAMILARAWRRKSLSVIFDADFICLAAGTILYAGGIYLFFPDFITTALPLIIDLYAPTTFDENPVLKISAGFILGCVCAGALIICAENQTQSDKKFAVFFAAMAALAVAAFAVQAKGFALHLIPARSLFFPAIALTVYFYLPRRAQVYALSAVLIACTGLLSWNMTEKNASPPEKFIKAPFAKFITENATQNGFIVETATTSPFWQIAAYNDITIASRFPNFWFLGAVVAREDLMEPAQRIHTPIFARMIADDIERLKPDILLLLPASEGGAFLNILALDPALERVMKSYRRDGIYDFDYRDFAAVEDFMGYGKTRFEVYRRK
jgi:hypothetical protein